MLILVYIPCDQPQDGGGSGKRAMLEEARMIGIRFIWRQSWKIQCRKNNFRFPKFGNMINKRQSDCIFWFILFSGTWHRFWKGDRLNQNILFIFLMFNIKIFSLPERGKGLCYVPNLFYSILKQFHMKFSSLTFEHLIPCSSGLNLNCVNVFKVSL